MIDDPTILDCKKKQKKSPPREGGLRCTCSSTHPGWYFPWWRASEHFPSSACSHRACLLGSEWSVHTSARLSWNPELLRNVAVKTASCFATCSKNQPTGMWHPKHVFTNFTLQSPGISHLPSPNPFSRQFSQPSCLTCCRKMSCATLAWWASPVTATKDPKMLLAKSATSRLRDKSSPKTVPKTPSSSITTARSARVQPSFHWDSRLHGAQKPLQSGRGGCFLETAAIWIRLGFMLEPSELEIDGKMMGINFCPMASAGSWRTVAWSHWLLFMHLSSSWTLDSSVASEIVEHDRLNMKVFHAQMSIPSMTILVTSSIPPCCSKTRLWFQITPNYQPRITVSSTWRLAVRRDPRMIWSAYHWPMSFSQEWCVKKRWPAPDTRDLVRPSSSERASGAWWAKSKTATAPASRRPKVSFQWRDQG